jgi:hypothetical protein
VDRHDVFIDTIVGGHPHRYRSGSVSRQRGDELTILDAERHRRAIDDQSEARDERLDAEAACSGGADPHLVPTLLLTTCGSMRSDGCDSVTMNLRPMLTLSARMTAVYSPASKTPRGTSSIHGAKA